MSTASGRLCGRGGTSVLAATVIVGVLVASLGIGYTTSQPTAPTGGAYLAKGDTIAYVNGESGRVEAESLPLAASPGPLEVVALADGRIAVVDRRAERVHVVRPDRMRPDGTTLDLSGGTPSTPGGPDTPVGRPGSAGLTVVAAPDAGYVVDPAHGRVARIGAQGDRPRLLDVPGATGNAVPDSRGGIWVLTDGSEVVRVSGDRADKVDTPAPVLHLTTAGDRAVGVTDSGTLLYVDAEPVTPAGDQVVPSGNDVVTGSPRGAGRWLVVLGRRTGHLVALDPATGERHDWQDIPHGPEHDLGAPVQAGGTIYVPDFTVHSLQGFDTAGAVPLPPLSVPGRADRFSLEVRDGRVWASDQFDRRALLIGTDGSARLVDKGTGHGVLTDTADEHGNRHGNRGGTDLTLPPTGASAQPGLPVVPAPPAGSGTPPAAGTTGNPAPSPPASPPPPPPAVQQVRVPAVEAGIGKEEACALLRQAGLDCVPVASGEGGPTNTVISISPVAGTTVPRGSAVIVRHYGKATVPAVDGLLVGEACERVEVAFDCVQTPRATPAASLDQLGVVAGQDPAGGSQVDTGSPVRVEYWNSAVMPAYAGRPAGADACAEFMRLTRAQVPCRVVDGVRTEAMSGLPRGTVDAQDPPAGSPVAIGQAVTLQVIIASPRVPTVPEGTDPATACARVSDAGFGCDAQPVLARHAGVLGQSPAPGTAMDGGTVVVRYSPAEPELLRLYQLTGSTVWALRLGSDPIDPGAYHEVATIGYAYRPGASLPGVQQGPVLGYSCTAGVAACRGHRHNRFYSRDATFTAAGWQASPLATFIAPVGAACATGQVPLYRNWYDADSTRTFTVERVASGPGTHEFLGCVWTP